MIKDLGRNGEKEFYSNEAYSDLWDIPVPPCFVYIFNVFIELYNSVDGGITFNDIKVYCDVRKVELKQIEIDYILKMKSWAASQIHEMEKDEE